MLDGYLTGSIGQLLERARSLQAAISKPYPREFHALAVNCRAKVKGLIDELQRLLSDPRYATPGGQPIRLREYKNIVADLDCIEWFGFAALVRATEEDRRLTKLVGDIAEEVIYPLVPPVASCQSQAYFEARTPLGLLNVPLKEVNFLLHLPDLYHELTHFILAEEHNPAVESFQAAQSATVSTARAHLAAQICKPSRGPKALPALMLIWDACWVRAWAEELLCDLFATFAVGPAFGWSHLHLSAKRGGDPFLVSRSPRSTHPPDEARMFVILEALTAIGYAKDAGEIDAKWRDLLAVAGYKVNADYQLCFPKTVLKTAVVEALKGYDGMKCRRSRPSSGLRVHDILNEAWRQFWISPAEYAKWERVQQQALCQ